MSDSEVLSMNAAVVDGLIVKPGDTLIVRFTGRSLTASIAAELRTLIMQRLPDLADVIVLNADGLAVYRPDEATA